MSKLTLNDIESLLVNQYKKDTEVEQLIYYYAALKEKLENLDNQSWFGYFGDTMPVISDILCHS